MARSLKHLGQKPCDMRRPTQLKIRAFSFTCENGNCVWEMVRNFERIRESKMLSRWYNRPTEKVRIFRVKSGHCSSTVIFCKFWQKHSNPSSEVYNFSKTDNSTPPPTALIRPLLALSLRAVAATAMRKFFLVNW